MIRSLVGTVCYQPPEMWTAHPKYDSKVDVYSCAMVFWEMLQWHKAEKKYPWEGSNECVLVSAVAMLGSPTDFLDPCCFQARHLRSRRRKAAAAIGPQASHSVGLRYR